MQTRLEKAIDLSRQSYDVHSYLKNSVAGVIEENEDEVWFGFRGSYTLKSWIFNINLASGTYPYGNDNCSKVRIHQGFADAYKQARDIVLESARGYKKVYLCGHSLGAAIALVAAVDIQYNLKVVPEVYGFGCPNVGNKYWIASLNRRVPTVYLYRILTDPVPYLPFKFETQPRQQTSHRLFLNPHCIESYAKSC